MRDEPLHVLLIDDDEDYHIITQDLLDEIAGVAFDVEWANTFDAGLKRLTEAVFDVCLLDYRLGQRTGLELLEAAHARGCTVPIVMFTGQDDLDVDRQAISTGAFDFLIKGQVSPAALDRAIRHAIEQGRMRRTLGEARGFLQSTLDALPMHIAILDEAGTVVHVNSAWHHWRRITNGGFPACATGVNYPAFCRDSTGQHSDNALNVLDAIESVLRGDVANVSIEYACQYEEENWFLLHATSFYDADKRWIVTSHEEVTRRKQMQLELEKSRAELQELSIRDALTGLYNRRQFNQILHEELARSRRYGHSLSLVMLDVDEFKHVNDTYGHQAGDDVIRGVAETLIRSVRESDWLIRYGGDEVAWILPETAADAAYAMGERMRTLIAATQFSFSGTGGQSESVSVSATLGVATFPHDGADMEELIASADAALYEAKRAGRNCVVTYHNMADSG